MKKIMKYAIIGVVLIGVLTILSSIHTLQDNVSHMNSILNKIAKQVGVPGLDIDSELRALVAEGKKVQAVKKVRMVLGLSLLEAKEYVDSL
jgi:ribosomal protein L7/L12